MGAGGGVGRLVLQGLLAAGTPVRASSRTPRPGQVAEGVEVVTADLTDPASLQAAFTGVQQVFLYAAAGGVEGIVQTAAAAGVHTLVLMSSGSVLVPTSAGNAITEEHRAVEDAYAAAASRAGELQVVAIHPLVLASNALGWAPSIRAAGVVNLYQPEALSAPVHERDVAAVAVAALTGADREAVTALLTGPLRVSQREQVQSIATTVGREINVHEMTRREAIAQCTGFTTATQAEAIVAFLDDCAAGNSPATDTVKRAVGRAALTFDAWAQEHAEEFR